MGGAIDPEKASSKKKHCPGGNLVRGARPLSSASSRRVTMSQAGTRSARTFAENNPVSPATKGSADVTDPKPPQPQKEKHLAPPQLRALDEAHCPNHSLSPPTDNSGNATESPAKVTWADAAERKTNAPIPTPTLHKTGEKSHVALPSVSPKDNR